MCILARLDNQSVIRNKGRDAFVTFVKLRDELDTLLFD